MDDGFSPTAISCSNVTPRCGSRLYSLRRSMIDEVKSREADTPDS